MIKRHFDIKDWNLHYDVGLNHIEIPRNSIKLERLLQITNTLQIQFSESIIQFFDDFYILNTNHVFIAIYHALKAFAEGKNISNRQNIEILLYLSCNRQIRVALENFGIKEKHLMEGYLTYCIISPQNNIEKINEEILNLLNALEKTLDFNQKLESKYDRIIDFFNLSWQQIKAVLYSYNISNLEDIKSLSLEEISLSLEDLIAEGMSLLSLENI